MINGNASDCSSQLVMKNKKLKKHNVPTKSSNMNQSKNSPPASDRNISIDEVNDFFSTLVNDGVTKKKLKKQKKHKDVINDISSNMDQSTNLPPTTDRHISIDETNGCIGELVNNGLYKKNLKKLKKHKDVINENSSNMDQSTNLPPTTNRYISIDEANDCIGELVNNGVTKKKIKKQKKQKDVINDISFNMDQSTNLPPTTDRDISIDEANDCIGEMVNNGVIKKKIKKQKKQKDVINDISSNMDQSTNLPPTTDRDISIDDAKDSIGELVNNGVTKKKLKKQKKQKDVIDEHSFNIDQRKNPPSTTDRDNSIDETNDCIGELAPDGTTKKKLKKQKVQRKRQSELLDEANDCNGDLVTEGVTKKKLKKQKVHKKRLKEIVDESSFNIDQCRNPLEHEEHWALRRAFLEKNQHNLPQDELICLAQVYLNVTVLGCWYAPETMETVTKLSEGLGRDYHGTRAFRLKPTFVRASNAAICKVRNLHPTDVAKNYTGAGVMAVGENTQDTIPSLVLNCLRSDLIIINGDMQLTMKSFNSLKNGMTMETCIEKDENGDFEGIVKVGGVVITKTTGYHEKLVLNTALRKAKEFLMQYCYSISYKTGLETSELKESKLNTDNAGFELLSKIDSDGGNLGIRDHSHNRDGLEMNNTDELTPETIIKTLQDFGNGINPESQIVFNIGFSPANRKFIYENASKMNLKTKSYGEGRDHRIVVTRTFQLRPTEVLRKLLVEKEPNLCNLYDVTLPAELV